MGTWFAEHAIAVAISLIGGFVATFLAKKSGAIMDAIEEKLNIDIDDKLEERISLIIRKVVMAVTQTYVKGLKKSGEFDDEAKNEALKKAIENAGEIIKGELGIIFTTEALTLAIESELGEQKEIEKVIGGANGPKGIVKKKARKKRS
jgi:hypothetical protein